MVKLALVDRALGSSVIPAGSAANLRHQQKHHSVTSAESFSLERNCAVLKQKRAKLRISCK